MTIINVHGTAIREGISRNGIKYTHEELEKFAPTLADKPILKDHEAKTDNTIGRTTATQFKEENVQFTGWIKEDGTGITEKIKDGRIKEVSIGAIAGRLVKETEDSEYVIAKDLEAMELSTTPTPGIVGTSISQSFESGWKKPIGENIQTFISVKNAEELAANLAAEAEHEDYKCPECDKKFKDKKELKDHMGEAHEEKEKMDEVKSQKEERSLEMNNLLLEMNKVLSEVKNLKEDMNKAILGLNSKPEEKILTKGKTDSKAVEMNWDNYVLNDKSKSETGVVEFFRMPGPKGQLKGGN